MKSFLLISAGVIYGIVALLLLGAVLLQESKGGGLAALGGTRAEGAFGASNPLRRLTAVLAVIFFLLASVLSLALTPKGSVTDDQDKDDQEDKPGTTITVPIEDGEKKPFKLPESPKSPESPEPPKGDKKPVPKAPEKDAGKGEAEPGEKAPAGEPAGKPEEKPAG